MEILVILPCSLFSVHSLICSGSFSSFLISDWTDVCAAAERSSMPKIKKSNRFNIFCYILDRKAPAEWGELILPWCNQYPSPLRVMNNQGRPAQPPPVRHHPLFLHRAGRNPVAAVPFLITYYDNNIIFRCYLFLVLQRLVPFQPFQLLPKIFPTEIYFRLTTYSPVHLKKRISMDVIHIDLLSHLS